MAADRRTRRLAPEGGAGQRTLDAPSQRPPDSADSGTVGVPPPETPPAAAGLEERQVRWLRERERAIRQDPAPPTETSEAEADPKG